MTVTLKCFYTNIKPQRSLDTRPSSSDVCQLIFAAHTGRVCNPVVFASSLLTDYIQCPHCQRRFNQSAAERHINFCKEQAARIPNKGKLEAKKTPIRTQVSPSTRLQKKLLSRSYSSGKKFLDIPKIVINPDIIVMKYLLAFHTNKL